MAGKSVLVVDTPSNCEECSLRYWGIAGWSCICARHLLEGPITEREEWCPLRPLPEPKDIGYPNDDYDVGFGDGWDACLKEITK